MGEITDSSNKKNIINLARNAPVALVVGAAGFLGSNLVEKLLEKDIQVIGIDNFKSGKRENLEEAVKSKNFRLLEVSADEINLVLERLDYIFVVAEEQWNITPLLKLFNEKKSRLLFVSSIDLYSKEKEDDLEWFKVNESKLARFAHENNLNARVLRLSAVYGPRMHFRSTDPIVKLIKKSLIDRDIGTTSEFSTRALYIDDAINLIIKCIFAGSTALKIFDGALLTPIKIDEVKQVLLDPLWHEQKNFKPTELPPWPTPNLKKTIQFLNWNPKADLVASLRKTLSYFRDNEIKIEPDLKEEKIEQKQLLKEWGNERKKTLEEFKGEKEKTKVKKEWGGQKFKFPKEALIVFLIALLVSYALLLPIFKLGWGMVTFRIQLANASENLKKGNFEEGLNSITQAENAIYETKILLESLESIRSIGLFKDQFETGDKLLKLAELSTESAKDSILGVEYLYKGLKSVTGELTEKGDGYFQSAQIELERADEQFAKAQALTSEKDFKKGLPSFLEGRVDSLGIKLKEYSEVVKNARALSMILPQVVAMEGSKSYLILLQNNNELRPTGGFIGSYAWVTFEGGKLKKLDVQDIYAIDGQLKFHVEPPKEIKEDLGQKDWFLRDSNWESDFPTAAKQAEWFFNKETGQTVSGVIALNVSAIEKLLEVVGPLDLPDYKETVTADNLFERAITHAEVSFFPGSQAKKNFMTALSNALFNKLFFVPQQNWPGIVSALGSSLEEKHLSIFFDDPKLFSYLISQNWTAMLPRPSEAKKGQFLDFLAPVEANLGANKSNYYLRRNYNLETVIGKEGEIKHRLRINYTNTSPSDTWPAGKYKNRFRVYLPFGTKITRVLWGEKEITRDVESFVDYGRSGFSLLLEVLPKETKTLVLDYEIGNKLTFEKQDATYKLDIVKQSGTLKDPFEWKLSFPLNYQLVSQDGKIAPQELTISTDLSTDKSFEVKFKK